MATESQTVLIEKKDGVAWLTINRAEKRNAINMAVTRDMTGHLSACLGDSSVKAIMLTSAGDVSFCAGNDLNEFKDRAGDAVRSREFDEAVRNMQETVRTYPKPVIAVINGFCLGGGMTLAGACDAVVASDKAEFGLPEIARGGWPAMATTTLMHNLPRKHAAWLILTGRKISAQEAMMMGFVSQVVPAARLREAADELARQMGGYDLEALMWAKKVAYDSLAMDFERSMQYGLFASNTFRSTSQSFEKGIGNFLKSGS